MSSLGLLVAPAMENVVVWLRVLRARASLVLLLVASVVTVFAIAQALSPSVPPAFGGTIVVDATSRLFLATLNPIFLAVCVYIHNRVAHSPVLLGRMGRFVPCALTFLLSCNAVLISSHLLVLWIALEVTTLSACPMIAIQGTPAARQASFRYLLFSFIALGLVFLGVLCASRGLASAGPPVMFLPDGLAQ